MMKMLIRQLLMFKGLLFAGLNTKYFTVTNTLNPESNAMVDESGHGQAI